MVSLGQLSGQQEPSCRRLFEKQWFTVSSNIGGCQGCPPRVATVDDAKAGLETVVSLFSNNSLGSLVDVDYVLGHLSEQHEPSYHGGK